MNLEDSKETDRAFTLLELLLVLAIIAILAAMIVPAVRRGCKEPGGQARCLNNLRQINLAFSMWADAKTNRLPWEVTTNNGGSMEGGAQENAAVHYLPIVTSFISPRAFVCPTEKSRLAATNTTSLDNSNLSYFLSLSASLKSPSPSYTILAGDRHLSLNNQAVHPGLFETTNSVALAWTTELHNNKKKNAPLGVFVFADGHGEIVKSTKLAEVFQRQSIATNRLAIP